MQNKIIAFFSHPVTLAVIKIIIGGLFIVSSITKLPNPDKFAESIAAYKLVPDVLIPPLSVLIPWLQVICGVLLVLDIYSQSAALIFCGLLAVYTAAITIDYFRGFQIDCGCFDLLGLEDTIGIRSILRDIGFLAITAVVVIFDKNTVNFYGLVKKIFK
jgi:putative oxidoreductase